SSDLVLGGEKMKEYKDHPIKTFWKDKIRFK
ncbi:hypothetical protein AAHQ34_14900, partial [Listeria monocytogenes]